MTIADGSGYGRIGNVPDEDDTLTKVGFGTPMGEMLRRYWQPVCLADELGELPRPIRILGEDLVGFRDKAGRAGLLYAHCIHRGTSLEFGQIDGDGIRCCYHGWHFDVEGRCLDQPAEPAGSDYKDKVRQPWYPVQEYHGLVFAYMGPPDRKPPFLRYSVLEREGSEYGVYRDHSRGEIAACNWLQLQENAIDAWHTYVLHTWHGGVFNFTDAYSARPDIDFVDVGHGVQYIREATLPNGNRFIRISEVIVPTARCIPPATVLGEDPEGETEPARRIGWWVPVDDTHSVGFAIALSPPGSDRPPRRTTLAMPPRTYEDRQRMPDDWEAQVSQGPIASRAREHLGTSDRGVVMFRRLLLNGLAAIERGDDPPGILRVGDNPMLMIGARNAVIAPDTVTDTATDGVPAE